MRGSFQSEESSLLLGKKSCLCTNKSIGFVKLCHNTVFPTVQSNIVATSHEIKRHLLLGRKAMRNLDSVSEIEIEIDSN